MAYTPKINGGRLNFVISGNTAGNPQTVSTGSVYLAGGTNVTLSQNSNSVTFNAGPPAGTRTIQRWEGASEVFGPLDGFGQNSLSLKHVYIAQNVSGSVMRVGGSVTVNSPFLGANGTGNVTLSMGVYSLNASTLSLITQGSGSQSVTWPGSGGANVSLVNGMRRFDATANVNLTPGEYWIGALMATATTNQSFNITLYGNSKIAAGASSAVLMPIGSGIAGARDVILFQGMFSTTTNALPTAIQGSQINNTAVSAVMRANFYNVIYNATY